MDIEIIRRTNLELLIMSKYDGKQTEFCLSTRSNQGEISGLINGKRPFGEKKARTLEKISNLKEGWMDIDRTSDSVDKKALSNIHVPRSLKAIPLFRRPTWDSISEKGLPIKMIGCTASDISDETYAILVRNDSLTDLDKKLFIRKGDIVIIDPKKEPVDDCYVFASSLKYKMASLKVYRIQDGVPYLYTPNPDWQQKWLKIDDSIRIHGIVVEVIKSTLPESDDK